MSNFRPNDSDSREDLLADIDDERLEVLVEYIDELEDLIGHAKVCEKAGTSIEFRCDDCERITELLRPVVYNNTHQDTAEF